MGKTNNSLRRRTMVGILEQTDIFGNTSLRKEMSTHREKCCCAARFLRKETSY